MILIEFIIYFAKERVDLKHEWKVVCAEEENNCMECGEPLDMDNEYHRKWGVCDSYCYGKYVGVYS